MKQKSPFKPLWRIHNSAYRHYMRGSRSKKLRRYLDMLQKLLKIKR